MELSVKVDRLTKIYPIFNKKTDRLKETFSLSRKKYHEEFYALNEVSFNIIKGESFGIIGKNGSGKSTLLKILSGILTPTSGNVEVSGKVAALLELGAGFNPEMTGLENIFLNGTIMGYSREQMQDKVESILQFAGIGEFINQPVKNYSSGMFVRLAFAVSTSIEPEILIVDEALAVGDVFFRQKCYERLNRLKENGTTIILVSHALNEIEQYCDRTLLLNKGKMIMLDRSPDVVKKYYMMEQLEHNNSLEVLEHTSTVEKHSTGSIKETSFFNGEWNRRDDVFFNLEESVEHSNGVATFLRIGMFDEHGYAKTNFYVGDKVYFYYEIEMLKKIGVPILGTIIFNQQNIIVHGKDTSQTYVDVPNVVEAGTILEIVQCMEMNLCAGEYTFEVGFSCMNKEDYRCRGSVPQEMNNAKLHRINLRNNVGKFSLTNKKENVPTWLRNHGLCDLPNKFEVRF
ncbi:ABC transporter ATP-binding protein [Clostridium aminobutyricum]|uniref:ABC transporter ATP-binding protein n=1 Tax=Clostridium aminobutyricum TaxID=33953 RepID=A0A939DA64_CLOAM|nr:ABC transporter ATP-binding protein [Clostridium aminobutyricum]MBN7774047.1 ABC transporter ATP-binding protein [Clostridium aminobutyricum]